MFTRCISADSSASANSSHQRPACQARASSALTQPACGAAVFHAADSGTTGVCSRGAKLQPHSATSNPAAVMVFNEIGRWRLSVLRKALSNSYLFINCP